MSSTRGHILCVDDEDIPRTLRALVLRKAGYEVLVASSGAEAVELLATRLFDLVLTDQMMPGMAGTELTRRVKASTPSMPVVIISGMNEVPPGAELADRFLSKVEGPAALFQVVEDVLSIYRAAATPSVSTAEATSSPLPPSLAEPVPGTPLLQTD